MRTAEHDSKHATKDAYGNVTAKDQHGLDHKGKPRKKSDNWKFGDPPADAELNTT